MTKTLIEIDEILKATWDKVKLPKNEQAVRLLINQRMAIMENFITIYLAKTDAKIQDTMLIEQRSADGRTITYWCEPKGLR